jgi:uncharacterized membrane protein YphA (DoxX/SURF4 family)
VSLRRWDDSGLPLLAARLLLGGWFVRLGLLKLADPAQFLKLLRQYDVVSDASPLLLTTLAALLPWLEIWCGLLLLLGAAVRGVALTMLLMLTVFTVAVAHHGAELARERGLPFCAISFDCGCGSGEVNVCGKVLENSVLWLLALIALLSRSRRFCLGGRAAAAAPG